MTVLSFGCSSPEMAAFCGRCMMLDRAKEYLRESDYNISPIAELLGYDNVYYFCNRFKQAVHMSPLEYHRSITAMGDKAKGL